MQVNHTGTHERMLFLRGMYDMQAHILQMLNSIDIHAEPEKDPKRYIYSEIMKMDPQELVPRRIKWQGT